MYIFWALWKPIASLLDIFSKAAHAFCVSVLFMFNLNFVFAGFLITVFPSFKHPDKELHPFKAVTTTRQSLSWWCMCGFYFVLFFSLELTRFKPLMYFFNNWFIKKKKIENFIQEFPAGDICSAASHLMNSSNQPSVSYFYWFSVFKIAFFFFLIDTLLDTSVDS